MPNQKLDASSEQAKMTDWEREIAVLIIESLNLDVDYTAFAPSAPLYEGALGLDSIDMLEIATVLSQHYGVEIRSGDAKNEEIFASLRALADYVARNRTT
jgi:acyl carrier protein